LKNCTKLIDAVMDSLIEKLFPEALKQNRLQNLPDLSDVPYRKIFFTLLVRALSNSVIFAAK
jgi:hypothetical protein